MRARVTCLGVLLAGAALSLGCEDDDEIWDAVPSTPVEARAMRAAVGIVDAEAQRVLVLPVDGDLALDPLSVPTGPGYASSAVTSDGSKMLVLSRGVVPRRRAEDAGPTLAVIEVATSDAKLGAVYPLADPVSGIAVDPQSEIAVLHATAADVAFVQNPNELVVADLRRAVGPDNPRPISLRSFGGVPERFTFTPRIALPGGERRLLLVQTDRDVAILDLDDLTIPEITVRLASGPESFDPGAIAVSDGAPERDDDARVAIRVEGEPDVVVVDLLPLLPGEDAPQSYRAVPNVVHVGGPPSDIAFVTTDGGLRLAALVPSRKSLVVVDPVTAIPTEVDLGAPFDKLAIVTDVVGGTENGSDVALVWSTTAKEVAFVSLGAVVGQPYKSIDRIALEDPVEDLASVTGANRHLKILSAAGGTRFTVLDLLERTASPIHARVAGTRVTVGPDGARAWMVARGRSDVAQLDLGSLHPENLLLGRQVQDVFEVERSDGGRALVALHPIGAIGLTVLDAEHPSLMGAREYGAVLSGDLR